MSKGAVRVMAEPTYFVVACFNEDCPEHGAMGHQPPWVEEFSTQRAAEACAREHRRFIRDYWAPDNCPTCGQRVPAVEYLARWRKTEDRLHQIPPP